MLANSCTNSTIRRHGRRPGGNERRNERNRRRESSASSMITPVPMLHALRVGVLLVVACSLTPCSSFPIAVTGPSQQQRNHRQQQQQQQHSFDSKNYQSSSGGSSQRRTLHSLSHSSSLSPSSFEFALRSAAADEPSESLEEIKKRVPVTIRYSAGSGLKPYYLTVAKRVKDLYPDVLIEREKIDKGGIEDGGGGDDSNKNGNIRGTFEVAVDGKLVVRNRKATPERSIFVSMGEVDAAILRARKRRRPSTVYGENGVMATVGDNNGNDGNSNGIKDRLVKAHLEPLKQKAMELSQQRTAKDVAAEKK